MNTVDAYPKYGTKSLQKALQGSPYMVSKHSFWEFSLGTWKLEVDGKPNNFGTLYFMYMMLCRWIFDVKDKYRGTILTLKHFSQKLEFLNPKLFRKLKNRLDYQNLETTLGIWSCLYCEDIHCDGLHPIFLLLQLLSSSSPWSVLESPVNRFCISNIFQLGEKKYCFLINLTTRNCFFVCQKIEGCWDPPTQLPWPPWEKIRHIPVIPCLKSKSAFQMYSSGIPIHNPDFILAGWVDMKELKNYYLRFQIFDWRLLHGACILGLGPINHAGFIQQRVPGFIQNLKRSEGVEFKKNFCSTNPCTDLCFGY